ncbi:hypothetical protein MVEN_00041500 [Mycena venus]|uniref:Uncharacterized protein n=1 Tax=Mycena venus TaxID=2733690 RepID=A0A8H7DG35_9AGAR|nr:hypothetical protein MVEN_00041500 [Mycena venus]
MPEASQDHKTTPIASKPEDDGSQNSDVDPESDNAGGESDEENPGEKDEDGNSEEDEEASHTTNADSTGERSTNATNAHSPLTSMVAR